MNNYPVNNQNDVIDVSNGNHAIHANSGNDAIHAMIVAPFAARFAGLLLLHVQGTEVYFPLLPSETHFELITHQETAPSL